MRLVRRMLVVAGGLFAIGVVFTAADAGAVEPCGPAALGEVSFTVGSGDPVADLADLGPLRAGDRVTMTWTGADDGCGDLDVTLAAHRVDASPTAEVTEFESCTLDACAGSLSITVPDRAVVCRGDLVAATGPAQLDRSLYGPAELGAASIDHRDCAAAAPSAFAAVVCARNGIDVALGNTGEVDTAVLIRVDGIDTRRFEVAGGDERSALLDLVEDTPMTIEVLADGELILERTFRPDCSPEPEVPVIAPDCAAGGAAVTLDNPTPEPIRYVVVVDGEATEVVVGAYRVERHDVLMAEHAEREIAVMADDTTELARATVRRDCERPRASVSLDCASPSAVFVLANDGPSRAMVDLVLDGDVIVTIPLPGDERRLVVRLDVVEDQVVDAAATSAGIELLAERLNVDCEPPPEPANPPPSTDPVTTVPPVNATVAPTVAAPQVLGVSASRTSVAAQVAAPTGTLPATGTDPRPLVIVAGLLLTLGGACTWGSASGLEDPGNHAT